MVEKRILVIVSLAILIWALAATSIMIYYYMGQIKYEEQLNAKQDSLNKLAEDYDVSAIKRNFLIGEYATLMGEYQWFSGDNYVSLMGECGKMLQNLKSNYTTTLERFPEINRTFAEVLEKFEELNQNSNVTKEDIKMLLDESYNVFTALSTRELETFISQINMINVSLCIDYGNQTIRWYNVSTRSTQTLFDLTRSIAQVNYTYWPTMWPGHMLLNSVNGYHDGYWIWYYWNEAHNDWISGPVGCDAWTLENNGVYKWSCV